MKSSFRFTNMYMYNCNYIVKLYFNNYKILSVVRCTMILCAVWEEKLSTKQ